MKKHSVLLVDDDSTHQYSLGRHLEESGFEVLHAETGAQALALVLVAAHQPDVVLLDINLPDMTGFDICERLKQNPETRRIPVIFHSATHDTQSARERVIDLGATSFLSYPIDVEHLVTVVQGAIARARQSSPR